MKKGHGSKAGGYFRQIAMPLSSRLPVLRPVRRWPVRPGEERVRPERISMAETTQPSKSMKQNFPQLGLTDALENERVSNEIFRAEEPRPAASLETTAPVLTARLESQRQNQSLIYKDTGENPTHPQGESFETTRPDEAASSPTMRAPSVAAESHSTKIERIAEQDLGSQTADASAKKSGNESARVSPSFAKPVYESNTADDSGNRPMELAFEDETRPVASHRIRGRQDRIEIGSIEVRIVNPSPVAPAVAPPAPPRLRPMAGGTASSSGPLARGLRGPWGLRQG